MYIKTYRVKSCDLLLLIGGWAHGFVVFIFAAFPIGVNMKGLCFADKAAWVCGLSCWLSIAPLQPATHYPTAIDKRQQRKLYLAFNPT
jgi:hypothetical protein